MTDRLVRAIIAVLRLASRLLAPLPARILQRLPRTRLVQHLLPEGRLLVQERYLGKYRVNIDTTYPIERAMFAGVYDPKTQGVIRAFVGRGDTCLDIGANVGAVTLGLADAAGDAGTVFAIEPGPVLFDRLVANLALNPELESVVVPVRVGLSDLPGTLYWSEDPDNRGNATLLSPAGVPVAVTTLDLFVAERGIGRIDFVKLDVEGMELNVVRGGIGTIGRFRPVVYYETLIGMEKNLKERVFLRIEELLGGMGYEFFARDASGRLARVRYPALSTNTIAIPLEKVPAEAERR